MKPIQFLILVTLGALLTDCATVAPKELINARLAYQYASGGPAEQLVPAELHKAHEALLLAEKSFKEDDDSFKTRDLAYVAQRKSEQVEALVAMAADKVSKAKADANFQKKQSEIINEGKQELSDSEQRTADAQAELIQLAAAQEADAVAQKRQTALIKEGKQALIDSEKRTAGAVAELAKLAAVKEEARGLVVTLTGSVLFRSGKSTLLPSAQGKLDEVAHALLMVPARNLIVEGHTDSAGSALYNQGLSHRRAEAVSDYLVKRGYPQDRIQARGMGEGSPIAVNDSPEGYANNRRVEIIIERDSKTTKN